MPKPISSVTGARRPKTVSKSRGAASKSSPYRGQRLSRARCCASVIRPPRITNERMERGCSISPILFYCRKSPAALSTRLRKARLSRAISVGLCGDRCGWSAGLRPSIRRCHPPCGRRVALVRGVAVPRSANGRRPRMRTRPDGTHRVAAVSRRTWTAGTTGHPESAPRRTPPVHGRRPEVCGPVSSSSLTSSGSYSVTWSGVVCGMRSIVPPCVRAVAVVYLRPA